MTTARDMIRRSMLKVGILTKTETPSADEASDALNSLNNMISSWSNESMLIYSTAIESFPLTANVASYTIGSGQTFDTTKPIKIVDAFVRQSSSVDTPMVVITDENYDEIINKTSPGLPYFLNYNNGHPTGIIKLWPVPASAYTLFIRSEKQLTEFTLDSVIDLPAGWEQAIIYNLAILLAPEYGEKVDAVTVQIARESKGAIQRNIIRNKTMDAEPTSAFVGNIYNGWFR